MARSVYRVAVTLRATWEPHGSHLPCFQQSVGPFLLISGSFYKHKLAGVSFSNEPCYAHLCLGHVLDLQYGPYRLWQRVRVESLGQSGTSLGIDYCLLLFSFFKKNSELYL